MRSRPSWIAGAVAVAAAGGGLFFVTAGRVDLPIAWAASLVFVGLAAAAMMSADEDLVRERVRPGPGGRDRGLVWIGKVLCIAGIVLAGLDVRRGWAPEPAPWVKLAGLVAFGLGFAIAIRAMAANRFFSSVIRLQADRGHHLISSGPYRVVRHPGYSGVLLGLPGLYLAMGSWIATIPAIAFNLLVLRRLVREDRFLHERLPGYPDYSRRVRYRLIPGVW